MSARRCSSSLLKRRHREGLGQSHGPRGGRDAGVGDVHGSESLLL